jgi:hypothetical protein
VAGFATLSVVFLIEIIATGKINLATIILEGYYIFFTLFMAAITFKVRLVWEACGFLHSITLKSIWYLM